MRGIEEETHGDTTQSSSNGDSHDPGQDQETDSLEVDSLKGAVAQPDTDGGTGNAHGGRYGKRELREEEDGNGSTHLHGTASAGRVIGDLVAHDY